MCVTCAKNHTTKTQQSSTVTKPNLKTIWDRQMKSFNNFSQSQFLIIYTKDMTESFHSRTQSFGWWCDVETRGNAENNLIYIEKLT